MNAEATIQSHIVQYLRYNKIFVFSCPNGVNVKNFATRNILKATGLTSGVSDLIILQKGRIVFVEVKAKKGVQSDEQKEFQRKVESLGFNYFIWRSLDDCIKWHRTCQ